MAYSLIAYRGGVIVDPSTLIGDGGQAQNDNDIELLKRTGTYHRAATDPTPNDDSANTSGNGFFYDLSVWINTAEWTTWSCQDATPTQARWVRVDTQGQPPGAPDRSLQFNDAGNFAGDANLTWASSVLTIAGSLIATDARLNELLKFANWNNAAPSNSQIWSDASGNLSFFDAVYGQVATLSEVMAHVEPGAPVNSVQFNSAGSFGGSSALIWSGTRLELTAVSDNNAIIINGATTGYLRFDTTATGTGNIFSSHAWDLRALDGNVTIQALGAGGDNVTTRCADRAIFQDQTAATRVSIYTTASPPIGRVVIAEDSSNAISMGANNEAKIGFNGTNAHYSAPGHHFTNSVGINTAREIYALAVQETEPDRGLVLYSADRSENFQWRFNAAGTGFLMGSGPTYFQGAEFVVIRSLSQNIIMQTGAGMSFEIRAGTTINFRDFDAGNAVRVSFDTDASPSIARFAIPEYATNSIAIGQSYEVRLGYDGNQTVISSLGGTRFERRTGDNTSTPLSVRDLTSATGDMQTWSHEDTAKARVDHDGAMHAADFRFMIPLELSVALVPMPGPGGQTEASAVEYQPGIIAFVHRKNFDEGLWFTGLVDGKETDVAQGLAIFVTWIYDSATADTVEFGAQGAAWGAGDAVPASSIYLSGAQSSIGAGLLNVAEINLPLTGLGEDDVVQFSFKIYRNRSGPNDTLNDDIHSLGYFVAAYAFGPAHAVS